MLRKRLLTLFDSAVDVVESFIERAGDPQGVHSALMRSQGHVSELSLENEQLQDTIDSLRKSQNELYDLMLKPPLSDDELRAISYSLHLMDQGHVADFTRDHIKALEGLVKRLCAK